MTEKEMCNLMIQDIDNWDKIIIPNIIREEKDEYCVLADGFDEEDWIPFGRKHLSKDFEYGVKPGDVVIQMEEDYHFYKGQRWMIILMPPLYYEERKSYPLGSEDLYSLAYSVFTIGARCALGHINEITGEVDGDYYDIVDLSKNKYIKTTRNKGEEIAYQNHIVNRIPIKHVFAGW